MDDLNAPRRFFFRFTNLVGRQQSCVDEFSKDLGSRIMGGDKPLPYGSLRGRGL